MPNTKDNNKTKIIKEEVMKEKRITLKKNKKLIITIACAVVAVILIMIFFFSGIYERFLDFLGIQRDVSVVPTITEISAEVRGEIDIGGTKNVFMVHDEKGVTGYDISGQWIWNEACSIENPFVQECDKYTVIADIGGTAVYAFGKDGVCWKYGAANPIISVFARGDFVGIIHEENEYLCALSMFKHNSKTKSLEEVFTKKISNHYMISGAISKDCKQIALCGAYTEGDTLCGIISFIKMSDGETFANETIKDNIYLKIDYVNNDTVFASNSDSVVMVKKELTVSAKNDKFAECWDRENKTERIIDAVTLGNGTYAVAFIGENTDESIVKGYDKNGKECFNIKISGNIIGIDAESEFFMAYTNTHIYAYNNKGMSLASQEAGYEIIQATCYGNRYVAIYTREKFISVGLND